MRIASGVYPRYYYDDLVGADARRLTMPENAARLWGLLEDEQVIFKIKQPFSLGFQVRNFGISLFETLYELFNLLTTEFQSAEQKIQFGYLVERIQQLWATINPTETVPLKMHALTHLREMMSREGHAGREIETIEHVHRCLNILWPKYASVTPLSHRLFIIVSRFNSRNSLAF